MKSGENGEARNNTAAKAKSWRKKNGVIKKRHQRAAGGGVVRQHGISALRAAAPRARAPHFPLLRCVSRTHAHEKAATRISGAAPSARK
jgi:hypothetical protein